MTSPEGRILTRYAVWIVVLIAAAVAIPQLAGTSRFWFITLIGGVVVSRGIVVTPRRYAFRRLTAAFRLVWWLYVAEIALAGLAFVFAADARGNVAIALAALAAAVALEVFTSRREFKAHCNVGTIVPVPKPILNNLRLDITAEASGPANESFKNALRDIYPRIPTVVRAYLLLARCDDGIERRTLGVRFFFPWADQDAFAVTSAVFKRMFPAEESVDMVVLDDELERTARAVAPPFYQRPPRVRTEP